MGLKYFACKRKEGWCCPDRASHLSSTHPVVCKERGSDFEMAGVGLGPGWEGGKGSGERRRDLGSLGSPSHQGYSSYLMEMFGKKQI